jgi:hypothetical protein
VQDTEQAQEWQIVFRGSKAGTNVAQITIDIGGLFDRPPGRTVLSTPSAAIV